MVAPVLLPPRAFRHDAGVDNSQPLLVMEREWPWGLVVLADPEAREPPPGRLSEDGVAASRSAVAAGVRHAVDGAARVEVWLGDVPGVLACLYDDEFTTDSGEVALSDAGNEQVVTATVGAGTRRLRVFVGDLASPERVAFELGHVLGEASSEAHDESNGRSEPARGPVTTDALPQSRA